MVTEIVDLDLGSNSSFKIIVMEGDIRSRFIEFHLSYNGEVFNLQNKSVKCRYVNGRTTEEVNLVINDRVNGVCTLEIPYRITSSAQNEKCELVISQSGEILSTIPFGVEVVKSLVERATVESSNEFGALTNALWKIDGVNAELNNINSQLEHKVKDLSNRIDNIVSNTGDGTKDTEIIDTRAYIDISDFKKLKSDIKELYQNAPKDNIEQYLKKVVKSKRLAVLKNIGICIGALGVLVPGFMIASRYILPNNREYKVMEMAKNENQKAKALSKTA